MSVFAFDPGAKFTGVAHYSRADDGTETFEAEQLASPVDCWLWMTQRWEPGDYTVIENYLSGGHATPELKQTIKVIGFLVYVFQMTYGYQPFLQAPQLRSAFVGKATALIDDQYPGLSQHGKKDAVAALAHAIRRWEDLNVGH